MKKLERLQEINKLFKETNKKIEENELIKDKLRDELYEKLPKRFGLLVFLVTLLVIPFKILIDTLDILVLPFKILYKIIK